MTPRRAAVPAAGGRRGQGSAPVAPGRRRAAVPAARRPGRAAAPVVGPRRGRVALLVAGLLVAGLLAAGCTGDADPAPAPGPSAAALPDCPAPGPPAAAAGPLPDLELPCLDGGPGVPLRRLTGTPTVVNLWAAWCAPCREELPAFSRLQEDAGARLRVLGVASKDARGNAVSFAADAGLPFPSLEDGSGELLRALRRSGLPVTVFVRADGSVAETYLGRALTDATLRAKVRTVLGVDV